MSKKLTHIGDVPLSKETAALFMPADTDPGVEAIAIVTRMQKLAKSEPKAEDPPPPGAELPDPGAYQLNLWSEPERGGPNPFLRSALFAAIQSEHREQIQGPSPANKTEPVPPGQIVTQKGLSVAYKGQQLDQYDLDVWLQAIHWARWQTTGAADCAFKGNAFLKQLGRSGGKINYDLLNKSLTRLTDGLVVIKQGTVTFTGHLISSFIRDDDTRVYKLKFADEILNLFGNSTFTRLQWKERRALKGKALPLWLHGFYSSHAKPYPLTVEYLHKLCGSRNAAMKSFRAKLKKAFEELEKVTGIKATFEGDTVTVERQPSGSQAKHLAKFLSPPTPPNHGKPS
jgi:hypothetical protein